MNAMKVYIASPYRIGDMALNVKRQIDAAEELMKHGFIPFTPLLSHFHQMMYPHDQEEWVDIDLEWIKSCDCVLRLPGESIGADLEVKIANDSGIPVFPTMGSLQNYRDYLYDVNKNQPDKTGFQ